MCVCVCAYVCTRKHVHAHLCMNSNTLYSAHVEIRGKLPGVFPLCGSWELNSVHRAWGQGTLPTESSHRSSISTREGSKYSHLGRWSDVWRLPESQDLVPLCFTLELFIVYMFDIRVKATKLLLFWKKTRHGWHSVPKTKVKTHNYFFQKKTFSLIVYNMPQTYRPSIHLLIFNYVWLGFPVRL